ncbi:uncharacterized protein C1orf131, partial [Austrofundulus limnaeus]|uniref:Uncharacterized protein C1orf131 n=1 Tax=Austrofundulus limnaeus TaxID=52670 RepID=A0A2I4AL22_AUSLI
MSSEENGKEDEDCLFLERVLDSLYDFGSEPKRKLKSQKNRKRKRCEEEEELPEVKDISGDEDSEGAEAQTCSEQLKTEHKAVQQVEVVTFQDPTKKPNTKWTPESNKTLSPQRPEQKQNNRQEALTLEKARLEVHRFGITGYKKEQQRVFEQDRAIMLGARVLQQQIKDKKQKEKEEFQPDKKKKKRNNQSRDKK